jgi:hydroxymethylpyrimidine pyrophosphatase-like HAD family hydrolase
MAVLALDLDQTLIYSVRSAGPLEGIETVWVEDYDGEPLSLMTATAHACLERLAQRHHVVPVTTRTPEQFARVRLPGPIRHAICSNGGVLLLDGVRSREWDERIAGELTAAAPAAEVHTALSAVSLPWLRLARQVEDLFVVLVAHSREAVPPAWVSEQEVWAESLGWQLSFQGRKLYFVPRSLSKGAAALEVSRRLGGPLLAAGDSLLDRSLLQVADFAVRPAHGELHDGGVELPGVRVTERSGAPAADDVLAALVAHADAEAQEIYS